MIDKCYLCMRIDAEKFYMELKELGFESDEAQVIVSWVKQIYEADPIFLCGRSSKSIKSGLAYVGVCVYQKGEWVWTDQAKVNFENRYKYGKIWTFSQKIIAKQFKVTQACVRRNYRRILKFMLEKRLVTNVSDAKRRVRW